MKLFVIFISVFYLAKRIYGQPSYIIGVQADYNNTYVLPSNFKIQYFSAPVLNTYTDLSAAATLVSTFDFIIYNYSLPVVMSSVQTLNFIPYLVIPPIGNSIAPPYNLFFASTLTQQTFDCTNALLKLINVSSVVLIDYQTSPLLNNPETFNNFTNTLVSVGPSSITSSLFVTTIVFNTESVYVCAIPLNQPALITSLLTEAMLKGQLNPGKTWLFLSPGFVEADFAVFQPFANVGAFIYSFAMVINSPVTSLNQAGVQQYIINDYVSMLVNSVAGLSAKPANLSANVIKSVLLNGQFAAYANFNPVTKQYNGSIVQVKRVNILPNTTNIYYCANSNVTQYNANSIIQKLSNPTVTVRVGMILSKGYLMQNPSGVYYGYSLAILNELLNLTTFKYVLVFPNVSANPNFTDYQQLNLMINNNLADIILYPMVLGYVTNQAYNSDPILINTISMITRLPDQSVSSITLAPLSYNVWFAILGIILITTLAFWAISTINSPAESNNKDEKPYSFGYSLLVIYSSFVMAKLKVKLVRPSSQLFAFILWFATLTLVITYASNLLPLLMRPNNPYSFTVASDLLNKTANILVFVNNSIDLILIQTDPVLSLLYSTAVANWPNLMFVNDSISETVLYNSTYILIQNSLKNSYIYHTQNCTSDMFTGTSKQYQKVFPMNNNFKQKVEMKSLFANLISSGVANSDAIIYFGQGPCSRSAFSNVPSPSTLPLNRLLVLFLLPLGGVVFGLGFVIASVLSSKLCTCIKNTNRDKFIVGETYNGKVTSIDHNGVWALINQRDRPYYIHASSLHPDLRRKHTPAELNITTSTTLKLKYFGNDPITGYKRFCKDFTEDDSSV